MQLLIDERGIDPCSGRPIEMVLQMTVNNSNSVPRTDKNWGNAANGGGNGSREPRWPANFGKGKNPARQVYGAIDLGTNNCRLLIARPVQGDFRIIDAFSRIVGLGEGLGKTGALSEEAMERAVQALVICAGKLNRREVTRMRAVATEACRAAANSGEFVDRVRERTGIALDVITPAEEARLAVMGCWSLLKGFRGRSIIFDIGGGSTEVILTEVDGPTPPRIIDWLSIPLGVVSLSDRIDGQEMSPPAHQAILAEVDEALRDFNGRNGLNNGAGGQEICLLGTSGTVTTLTGVHLGLQRYERNLVDGARVRLDEITALARDVAFLDYDGRVAIPCIGRERADLVVPGCAIFEALVKCWPGETLLVADRGIREGVLRNLMRRDPLVNAEPHPMPASGV